MSKCLTCDYALYDGMCLAQGKFTVLDADSCELYRPTQGYEVARLKRENEKLRELVRVYRACHDHTNACRGCAELPECDALEKMRTIGRKVGIEAPQ